MVRRTAHRSFCTATKAKFLCNSARLRVTNQTTRAKLNILSYYQPQTKTGQLGSPYECSSGGSATRIHKLKRSDSLILIALSSLSESVPQECMACNTGCPQTLRLDPTRPLPPLVAATVAVSLLRSEEDARRRKEAWSRACSSSASRRRLSATRAACFSCLNA